MLVVLKRLVFLTALLAGVCMGELEFIQLPPTLASPASVASRVDVDQVRGLYSPDEWQALQQGKVITSEVRSSGANPSGSSTVQASGIFRYPPAEVWTVLVDFPSRPKYHPSTKEARIVRVDGNRVWIAEHLKFLWVNIRFCVIDTLQPELGLVTWILDESTEHDIRGTKGSWQLTPLADGQHTLVNYRTWLDIGQPVPGFVEKFLINRSLPQMISGLRSEVDKRFGADGRPQ